MDEELDAEERLILNWLLDRNQIQRNVRTTAAGKSVTDEIEFPAAWSRSFSFFIRTGHYTKAFGTPLQTRLIPTGPLCCRCGNVCVGGRVARQGNLTL